MALDISRTRLGNWHVKWGPSGSQYDFGAVDDVTPEIEIVTKDIKVGTIGDVVLGKRIIALDGTITVQAREIDRDLLETIMPWYSTGDSIPMLPATVHKDLYDYAQLLTLTPTDPDDQDSDGEDLNFLKAVPLWRPMQRDGEEDDVLEIQFVFFPDRSQLPTLVYGYVGPVPS